VATTGPGGNVPAGPPPRRPPPAPPLRPAAPYVPRYPITVFNSVSVMLETGRI
jgi:hypothetical protein